MEEEVIAKTVKKLYLITMSIFLGMGVIGIVLGLCFVYVIKVEELSLMIATVGWVLFGCGIFLVILCAVTLIYFIRVPENAIIFKEDKLYFSNGTVCSPTEINSCKAKGMGPDGAMFGFGKILFTVNGKSFKVKYIKNESEVVNRIYMLIAQYQVKQNIAEREKAQQSAQTQENNREDK